MRVLVVGRFYTESFAQHIGETLEEMGHAVARAEMGVPHRPLAGRLWKRLEQARARIHDSARQFRTFHRRETAHLLDTARSAPVDLTIVAHDFLLPAQVDALRQATRTPIVLWFPDSVWSFGRAMFLNGRYDFLFFKDPYLVHRLRVDLGKRAYYLPECCNPRYHRPIPLSDPERAEFGCDVTTAGNLYSYRAAFFEQLADYDVRIWGNPPPVWMNVSGLQSMLEERYVANEAKAKAFLSARIVVNNLHAGEILGVNVRAFEIAAVGAFQLITWRPALAQLFEDGSELVSFTDADDLRRKIDHYLPLDSERARIGRAGMDRAHRDHTYVRRLNMMLDTIFGSAEGFPLPESAISGLVVSPGAL